MCQTATTQTQGLRWPSPLDTRDFVYKWTSFLLEICDISGIMSKRHETNKSSRRLLSTAAIPIYKQLLLGIYSFKHRHLVEAYRGGPGFGAFWSGQDALEVVCRKDRTN
jgi:hypothetical protein